jgi:predicted nucleic acid-binding protein
MFWDSSAVVPLLVAERRSAALIEQLAADREATIWWGTPLECESALRRLAREQALSVPQLQRALGRLRALAEDLDTIVPTLELRNRAARLLGAHPLRAADALQLAAALAWSEEQPAGEAFVCLDPRLSEAAAREGFTIVS